MSKKLGVCVVGAGQMGQIHIGAWKEVENAEIISISDVDEGRVKTVAEKYGIRKSFTDYKKAIDEEGVNVVSICTPTCFHPEVMIYSAQNQKDVFSEKPIALTVEEAEKMIAIAKEKKMKFGIGFMRRAAKGILKLKELIENGEIGRPVIHLTHTAAEVRPKVLMHDKYANGGPIIDGLCHTFDAWRFIFNTEAKRVFAIGFIFAKDKKEVSSIKELAIDTAGMIVELKSGDLGVITESWGMPKGIKHSGYEEFIGPEGAIRGNFNKELTLAKGEGKLEVFSNLFSEAHKDQIKYFADCIREDKEPLANGEDGLKALKVSLAILKSIETGEIVEI